MRLKVHVHTFPGPKHPQLSYKDGGRLGMRFVHNANNAIDTILRDMLSECGNPNLECPQIQSRKKKCGAIRARGARGYVLEPDKLRGLAI
jgi:hypothetical protein